MFVLGAGCKGAVVQVSVRLIHARLLHRSSLFACTSGEKEMTHSAFSVCVTGIGGLGVMWLSRVIADAACAEYEHVTRTESRGLSQRGGAVCSIVRFGNCPISPTSPTNTGDLLLALDQIEAVRNLSFLKPDGWLIS